MRRGDILDSLIRFLTGACVLLVMLAAPLAAEPPRMVQVAGGDSKTCAIDETGQVWCWGINNFNEQGGGGDIDNPRIDRWTPVRVHGLTDATQVSLGDGFGCALRRNGRVACWGSNHRGQLGNRFQHGFSRVPVDVLNLVDVEEIGAGSDFACARSASRAFCWGGNTFGQLGVSTVVTYRDHAVEVQGVDLVTGLAVGRSHVCAHRFNRQVACWGRNTSGELGDGTTVSRSTPVGVPGLPTVTQVAAGSGTTCVVGLDRTVACWGSNLGRTGRSLTPQTVQNLSDIDSVTVGGGHACVLQAGARTLCWGTNDSGQVGNGTTSPLTWPITLTGPETFVQVGLGPNHSCAVNTQGRPFCWGDNSNGQLGDATATNRSTYVPAVSSKRVGSHFVLMRQ